MMHSSDCCFCFFLCRTLDNIGIDVAPLIVRFCCLPFLCVRRSLDNIFLTKWLLQSSNRMREHKNADMKQTKRCTDNEEIIPTRDCLIKANCNCTIRLRFSYQRIRISCRREQWAFIDSADSVFSLFHSFSECHIPFDLLVSAIYLKRQRTIDMNDRREWDVSFASALGDSLHFNHVVAYERLIRSCIVSPAKSTLDSLIVGRNKNQHERKKPRLFCFSIWSQFIYVFEAVDKCYYLKLKSKEPRGMRVIDSRVWTLILQFVDSLKTLNVNDK